MIKQLLPYCLLMFLFIVPAACDKEEPVKQLEDNLARYLLKTITWNNGLTATCSYHDSTLQSIDYAFQGVAGKSMFSWTNKTLTELYDDRSLYKNVFEYDSQGRVVKMRNIAKTGSLSTGYLLEFRYNASGKVDTLRYFTVNEAGKHLQASTSYHYNVAGELEQSITQSGTSTITHTIDTWSPTVSFNPCNYIETSLTENYTMYNYAVMAQLNKTNKLPAKVTRVVKTSSQPSAVDKIEEHTYTITNHRIDKVVTTISFPAAPANNRTIESIYSYY